MARVDWRHRFDAEIQGAEHARAHGNEGRARVCSRRAAGIIAAEYFRRQGTAPGSQSSLDLLTLLSAQPHLAPHLRECIDHLTLRVDERFELPAGVDLIDEARRLAVLLES
jgi:hypothetical protein